MGTAMRWRGMVSGLLAATVVAAVAPASPARADDRSTYLVVLRDGAGDPAAVGAALVARVGGTLGFVYRNALPGFAASLPAAAIDNGFGVVGVAPGARLWSVKVLGKDGSGSLTGIMAGLDWVAGQSSTIEVVNLSLGCADCGSKAMSRAISAAVDRGVVVVV